MQHELDEEQVTEALRLLVRAAREKKADFVEFVSELYDNFMDDHKEVHKIKKIMCSVNKSAHDKPWLYAGVLTLGGFLLGVFWRRRE